MSQPDPCVLCFWKPSRSNGRKVWVNALLSLAEKSDDGYVKTFCLDQLRWCAPPCPCVLRRIVGVGVASGDKSVRDMSDLVIKEILMRFISIVSMCINVTATMETTSYLPGIRVKEVIY